MQFKNSFLIPAWLKMAWLLLLLLVGGSDLKAQWSARSSLPGTPRSRSAAFTLANKIYIVGGMDVSVNALNDFWEYDLSNDSWTQKTDFPGGGRFSCVSFTLGTKAYLCSGNTGIGGYTNELWEYDPALDVWTQKAFMPQQRAEALAFTIGNKAYVGFGEGIFVGPNNTTSLAFFDLWEYDAGTDAWTQMATIPDSKGRTMATAAVVNGKAYIGLGCNVDQDINHYQMWEYDPAIDTWTQRTDMPSAFSTDAGAFSHNGYVYILGGVNLNPVSLSNQVLRYDPVNDTWKNDFGFNGAEIAGCVAINAGNRIFAGTGFNSALNTRNDWWELTDDNISMSDFTISANTACRNQPLAVSLNTNVAQALSLEWTVQPTVGVTFIPSNTVTAPQVVFQNSGNYTLTCSGYSAQVSTSTSAALNISACTGLNNMETEAITIAPNPGKGFFEIRRNATSSAALVISVTDASGRLLLQQQHQPAQELIVVDLAEYGKGIYFLHINTGEQHTVKKLIVE